MREEEQEEEKEKERKNKPQKPHCHSNLCLSYVCLFVQQLWFSGCEKFRKEMPTHIETNTRRENSAALWCWSIGVGEKCNQTPFVCAQTRIFVMKHSKENQISENQNTTKFVRIFAQSIDLACKLYTRGEMLVRKTGIYNQHSENAIPDNWWHAWAWQKENLVYNSWNQWNTFEWTSAIEMLLALWLCSSAYFVEENSGCNLLRPQNLRRCPFFVQQQRQQ